MQKQLIEGIPNRAVLAFIKPFRAHLYVWRGYEAQTRLIVAKVKRSPFMLEALREAAKTL
jgi:hypothetical protein